MRALHTFILLVLFLFCGAPLTRAAIVDGDSATGTLDLRGESNVTFSQRTDGSKLVDIYYTLDGTTSNVALGVSLDGGTTFTSMSTVSGDVGGSISTGTLKHIVWNAGTDYVNSGTSNAKMRVTALLDGAGGTFAPIPGGTYSMGNLIGDSDITNVGTVSVTLSPYYMAVSDTTKAQWDTVRTWGSSNGYTDLATGAGKAANHPVQTVSWYDVVKWANAASEKDGLTPCYKVSGSIVRTGTSSAVTCDWSANGYRLPTEAEWEVAARGGLSGKRFPWGDTISQSQANYKASTSYTYDLSGSVNNYHPTYKTGAMPYTSPVGSFAANGYGLYDMAGNVVQWCWDWYGTPYAGGSDPHGAASGSPRVARGGNWNYSANGARSAHRSSSLPTFAPNFYGFRLARGRSSGMGAGTLSGGGVVDTAPPVLSVPGGVSVSATSASGAAVTFTGASATDNMGGTPTITYSSASGSTFPIGNTSVTVTATDSMGNVASGTFNVTVNAPPITTSNVTFSQRTDGSKLVDVYYTLDGGTSSVGLLVSLDGGTTFTSMATLSGDVGSMISAGTSKHIVWNAGADYVNSGTSNVKMRLTPLSDGAGGTFAPIPGGTYQIGNVIGESDITDASPVTVTLSPYYMAVNDTTKAQWDSVRTWASSNGYTDLTTGDGKAANHPVQTVSWYDAVKWANAASEKDGLTPCYSVGGAVYRTGNSDTVSCDWSANGYRLPTEAEWEVAARGGLSGKRFPWGDTISQSRANYRASTSYTYDLSGSVNDYHPTYKTGATPYTSPVGSFAANGYGLYDMVGNVTQWCWDWYGTSYTGGTDPRGPVSGSIRVERGGDWFNGASYASCANRSDSFPPGEKNLGDGFRLARGRSSSSGNGTLSTGGVVDTTPPVLTLPSNQSVQATSASGAVVTFPGASATDNMGGTPTITYSPASGSAFPIGTTTVTATATDAMGNLASGTFDVTVVPLIPPTILQQPSSLIVDSGSSASFGIAVSGDGPFTFQWRKNGAILSGGSLLMASNSVPAEGLVAKYSFDTGLVSEVNPSDVITLYGPTRDSGGYLNFADNYAQIPDPLHSNTNVFSASLNVFEVDLTDTAGAVYLIVGRDTVLVDHHWINRGEGVEGSYYGNQGGEFSVTPLSVADIRGRWVCYTVTSSSSEFKFYKDGVLLGTHIHPKTVQGDWFMGKHWWNNNTESACRFIGRMDDFAVWNRTLSASEVDQVYQSVRKTGTPSGTRWATITLPAVTLSDYGSYDVVVSNAAGSVTSSIAVLGMTKPRIVTQPASLAVVVGSTATFTVSGSGSGVLSYQWRKSGAPIAGATSSTYTIAAAQVSDAGNYDVVVTNAGGSVTSASATLGVYVPVSIVGQPVNATVGVGAAMTLSVNVTGSAPITYQWRKAGVNISGAVNSIYSIASAQLANAGSYDVVVTNPVGSVTSSTASVTVLEPVLITTQPSGLTLNPGSAATFTVVATGGGTLSYQWRKGGVVIPGATSASYSISAVSATHSGSYDVVVKNAVSSVTSVAATLAVNTPPSITTQPVAAKVNAGTNVTFKVVATGTAPLAYQWRKNGTPISGATSAMYTMPAVQALNAGDYDVVVSNVAGSVTSAVAALSLNAAPVVTTQPVGATVNPGSAVTLSVAVSGTAPITYQWRKNGAVIAGATSASYKISAVQTANVGSYDVVVSNVAGSVVSNTAAVALNTPVTITKQPVAVAVNPGGTASLSVTASGTVPLTYQWRKGGVAIAGANASTYTLANAQSADGGSYDVVVTNIVGSVTSTAAVVSVNVPVTIKTQPVGGGVNPGASKTLTVTVAGTAPLTYQWRLNGNNIAGATSASYALTGAVAANVGSYDVVVGNVVGSATSAAALVTLNVPVTITQQPVNAMANPGKPATFAVAASGTAPLSYQWRRNGAALSGATAAAYTVAAVGSGNVGSYDVVVRNVVGSVTSNAVTLGLNAAVTITQQPAGVSVNPGASATFTVAASGTGPLTYQWRKGGVAIAGATDASYTIASAQAASAASYDVVVTNVVGSVTSSAAKLSLNAAPSIATQPLSVLVNPGATNTFRVVANGTAPFTYQWRKGGAVIAGATGASYTIAAVQASDAADYDVVVGNVAGSVTSSTASLGLNQAPAITAQPSAVTVNAGASFSLSVSATGTGPLAYQWRRNGTAISGATAAAYTVASAQTSHAGNYDVMVSNVAGSVASTVALVTVNTLPVIVTQPAGAVMNPGTSKTLSVVASGSAPLSYQWRKNGGAIAGATAASMAMSSVQASDAGSYDVVVTNPAGSVTSNAAVIGVNTPITIVTQPVGGNVNAGTSKSLSVSATGTTPISYQWRKNGTSISGATGASYTIGSVQAGSAGDYDVVVSNVVGSVTSAVATVGLNVVVPSTNVAPTILTHPASQSLLPGGSVTLTVIANGTGPLGYQWRKDGAAMAGATLASYAATSAGVYDVVVSNAHGSATSNGATISALVAPSIVTQPVGGSVNPGTGFVFAVAAGGSGPLTYQWRKDGTPLSGAASSSYSIASAVASSAGAYDVVVSNAAGSVTSSVAVLTVNALPVIVSQPVAQSVNPGGDVTFKVVASGTGPLNYQWRRNGAGLGTNADSLTLSGVQPANSGNYDVVVSNVAGSATSSAVALTVNVPVTIITQPVSVSVNAGAAAVLSVSASGTGPLAYQWVKDGIAIPGATASTCRIGSAQAGDAGTYEVVVTNVVGSVNSNKVLVVLNAAPVIVTQPVGVSLNPGSSASLSVEATGTGPLSYVWRRDGVTVGSGTGTFTISNAQPGNVGNYDVVVSNIAGSVVSNSVPVTLNVAPVIVTPPVATAVNPGAAATFSVTATGTAPLNYQWRKDGVALAGQTGQMLSLNAAQLADVGNYDVVVTNVAGSALSAAAALRLNEAISFTSQLPGVSANPGQQTKFTVSVTGTGPITYQWRKNGVLIDGATGATFTINSTQSGDAGNYDVVVTNPVGSFTSNAATLVLNTPVSITAQPQSATVNPGAAVNLSVSATGTAPLTYQWYRNGVQLAGATAATYSIGAAQSTDAADYSVLVGNVVGSVQSTTATVALNVPVVIIRQPAAVTATQGAGASFSVQAAGTETLTYQWRKNGVDIPGATAANYSIASVGAADGAGYDVVVTNVVGSVTSAAATLTVITPVTIFAQLQSGSVTVGGGMSFVVGADGTGPLTYQWRKDGVPLAGATGAAYTILAAKVSDGGNYDVVVSNGAGSVYSATAVLSVNVPVTITTQPVDAAVGTGADVNFQVEASGTGPLAYQWRRNGVEIPGATAAILALNAVQLSAAGGYDVVVSNVIGSVASRVATLKVSTPVTLSTLTADVSVKAWADTYLSISVSGPGPVTYQWRKNGVPISGATSDRLDIIGAKSTDAGTYDVVVTTPSGTLTSNASTLSVVAGVPGRPVVLKHPVNSVAIFNTAASVSATVGSEGGYSYQWFHNGAAATGDGSSGTSDGGGVQVFTLNIPAVREAEEGLYKLVLTDQTGAVVESRPGAVRLEVSFGETRLLLKGWRMDLAPLIGGDNVSQDGEGLCSYVYFPLGIPKTDTLVVGVSVMEPVTYTWRYRKPSGGAYQSIPSHTNRSTPSLEFAKADVPKLKGWYVLSVNTATPANHRNLYFGAATFVTSSGSADPGPLPQFTEIPQSLVVPVGGAADFGAQLDGVIASYTWWKQDGVSAETAAPNSYSSPWYVIDSAQETDAAGYQLEAVDFFGRSVRSPVATLTVVPSGD